MDKPRIVHILEEMGDLLELAGANPFEIMAYRNGAQNLDEWNGELDDAVRSDSLTEIPGIGKGLARTITGLARDGVSEDHERLKQRFPETILELLGVSGLGPKRIRVLYEELGVASLNALETAARERRVRVLKGFGPKTEERIMKAVDRARRYPRRG